MGILNKFRKTKEAVPDFEFRTVEQIRQSYEFGLMGFLGFSTDWTEHCMELKVHEYPTLDFVRALAKYTTERSKELVEDQQRPLRVLEVAAGSGYIALGVRQQLDKLHDGRGSDVVEWRAVDADTYNYPRKLLRANGVAIADYKDELETYQPDMVFGAWIPHEDDNNENTWVKNFTETGVKEYLLTGYNVALTAREDDDLYREFCEDGYTQLEPQGFKGTQIGIRSDKASDSGVIIPNTSILSFRLDPQVA